MASGRTAEAPAAVAVADRLDGATYLTVLARPARGHLLAAATLAAGPVPAQVRVVDERAEGPAAPGDAVVATEHSIAGADVALEGPDPAASAVAVLERLDAVGSVPPAVTALLEATDEDARAPGVVAALDDLAAVCATSTRLYGPLSGREPAVVADRLADAGFPTTVAELREDTSAARRVASWLAATSLEAEGRPPAAADAMRGALRPTYVDAGPTPTREGLEELLDVLAGGDPGLAVASLLGDAWDDALGRYRDLAAAVHGAVGALPVDRPGPLVDADAPEAPLEPAVRLWTAFRLDAPYGLLVRGDGPIRLALASTGDRSASALLEAAASRHGGAAWGDEAVAGAVVPAERSACVATVAEAL